MNFIVYKTTNLINNKFYVGVHKNNNRNYIGSGKLLKQAIKKYGRENFKRETLKEFSSEQDAYGYEKELVNEEMINNPLCYNLVEGGGNPPSQFGRIQEKSKWFGRKHTKESIKKMSEIKKGKIPSEETKEKISKANKGKNKSDWYIKTYFQGSNNPFYNKKHTLESIKKIKESRKTKKIYIWGNLFYSIIEASECLKIPETTLRRWCADKRKIMCYEYKGI